MSFEYSVNELYHHGIKGQKWGIRRFQNDDGSLTDAGRKRYGDSEPKTYGKVANAIRYGSFRKTPAEKGEERENKLKQKVSMYKYRSTHTILGNPTSEKTKQKNEEKAKKAQQQLKAQKAKNANRNAYDSRTSTGKMVAQNMLFGSFGAERYRDARARGEKKGRAVAEALLSGSITMAVIRNNRNKQAYGAAVR